LHRNSKDDHPSLKSIVLETISVATHRQLQRARTAKYFLKN
jgi:hypothetical protein